MDEMKDKALLQRRPLQLLGLQSNRKPLSAELIERRGWLKGSPPSLSLPLSAVWS